MLLALQEGSVLNGYHEGGCVLHEKRDEEEALLATGIGDGDGDTEKRVKAYVRKLLLRSIRHARRYQDG